MLTTLFIQYLVFPLRAQQGGNLKFTSYSTRAGLSSSNQQCITQDREGFIWIGTVDGLNRFDGYSFKVYRKISGDSTSLRNNTINALYTDSRGDLWVGTYRGGLSRYNKERDHFTYFSLHYPAGEEVVTAITEDSHHRLWIGTFDGLFGWDPKENRFVHYPLVPTPELASDGGAYNQIRTLQMDGETLWIGTSSGIISALNMNTLQCKHYKVFDAGDRNVREYMVTSFCADGDQLWIGTWGKGLWQFNKKTGDCRPVERLRYVWVNHIMKDNQNQLWIGTESDGVLLLNADRQRMKVYLHDDFDPSSLSTNTVSRIFQDRQQNYWLLTNKGDLHYLNRDQPFRTWRRNPNQATELTKQHVTSVLEDRQGRVWVGYQEGGLDIFNPGEVPAKRTISGGEKGLGTSTVAAIYESRNGTIWVGTYLDGLKRYDERTGTFASFLHHPSDPNSLSCNNIKQITEDSQRNLWLATHGGGLEKWDPATNRFIHHRVDYARQDQTIGSDWLLSVKCDSQDQVWVGSVAGVSRLNPKDMTIRHYRHDQASENRLSDNNVYALLPDSKGMLWIGTHDGLNQLDPATGKIKVYSLAEGLPNGLIVGLLEDDQGYLWVATGKGLARFSIQEGTFRNYFSEDGLCTDEFSAQACYRNARGEMYFGGREGLSRFHPDQLQLPGHPPAVYLTDLKLFNRPVPIQSPGKKSALFLNKQMLLTEEIVLEYDQNSLAFEFVALDFKNPAKNRYAYRMKGFDQDWSQPSSKREATYTNLPAGNYVFEVKAAGSDGVWSTQNASVRIIIHPPFWQTNWAILLYVLLGSGLLYGCWRLGQYKDRMRRKLEMEELEIKKLQEMDNQKMHFFSNISHEFRTPLTLIASPLDNLLKTVRDESQRVQLGIIQRNTQRLLRLINQLMDFRKLENEPLPLLLTRQDIHLFVRTIAHSFLMESRQRSIHFRIHTEETPLLVWFDRDKVENILYNLLGNAFKFTPVGGNISLEVRVDSQTDEAEKGLLLIVEDTGIGMSAEVIPCIFDRFYQVNGTLSLQGTGIGLALTKELVQLHGGHIQVASQLGKGTRFTVFLPFHTHSPVENVADKIPDHYPQEPVLDDFLGDWDNSLEILPVEANQGARPTLLIVEDNGDMLLFIRQEFREAYRIVEAADGLIGLEQAIAHTPDVIISDVMMPGMDGVSMCRKIKTDLRTSHIPVILLTARGSEDHTLEGLQNGADDYIAKPFNSAILQAKIRNLIASRRALQNRFLNEPEVAIAEISPSRADEKFLMKVYEAVEAHLTNPDFEAQDFARVVGMSRAQLYRKIKALTGQSVKEFLRIIRLKKSAELLLQTDYNISEVAYQVGFNSLPYFTKSFREYFQQTPTQYIARHRPIGTVNDLHPE